MVEVAINNTRINVVAINREVVLPGITRTITAGGITEEEAITIISRGDTKIISNVDNSIVVRIPNPIDSQSEERVIKREGISLLTSLNTMMHYFNKMSLSFSKGRVHP